MNSFDLSAFLPYRLAVLSERISRRLAQEYGRSHGISLPEWRVLVHLARCKQASVREIHDYANLEKPRVSRTVAKLQKAGLVRKIANRRDSRLVEISLTEQGRTVLGEIVTVATEFESRLVQVLSNEELATLPGIAEKLHSVLDDDPLAPKRSSLDKPAD